MRHESTVPSLIVWDGTKAPLDTEYVAFKTAQTSSPSLTSETECVFHLVLPWRSLGTSGLNADGQPVDKHGLSSRLRVILDMNPAVQGQLLDLPPNTWVHLR